MTLESLRTQVKELEADIEGLEEKLRISESTEATRLARAQARIFLERVFAPYMDGICQEWGVSPEEALRILINTESNLGKIAKNNPEALKELMNQPAIKAIVAIAGPLKDVSEAWIDEKTGVLFEVMVEIRPNLARGIAETPGGTQWFHDSLTGLRDILFSTPKLDPVTE